MKTTLLTKGCFYKGNIHSHTTRSDGRLSPEDVIKIYQKSGYDFIAITDHNVFADLTKYNTESFIIIPGIEITPPVPEGEIRDYHFLALAGPDDCLAKAELPGYTDNQRLKLQPCHSYEDLQNLIDDQCRRGYMVTINHPFWTRAEYDQILPLKNLVAMEVFNFGAHILENMGESATCWDALMRNGMKLWGTAVDDNHNIFPLDGEGNDSFGGFIMVKAKSLLQRDICSAIAQGSFYASTGPEIYDFYVENNEVHFRCSPATRIYINGDVRQIRQKYAEKGKLLTEFTSKLYGNEKYVRVECYDENGKKAYTNPIWL